MPSDLVENQDIYLQTAEAKGLRANEGMKGLHTSLENKISETNEEESHKANKFGRSNLKEEALKLTKRELPSEG